MDDNQPLRRLLKTAMHPLALPLVRQVIPALSLVFVVACAMQATGLTQLEWVRGEGGLFEVFSAVGYWGLAGFLIVWIAAHRAAWLAASPPSACWTIAAVLAAMGGRELDFHKRFTSANVMKTSYYIDPAIPMWEKTAAVSVLAIIGLAVGRLLWVHGPGFLQRLAAGSRATQLVASGLAVVLVSKVTDRSVTLVGEAIGGMPATARGVASVFEEFSELWIPIFFSAAAVAYLRVQTRSARRASTAASGAVEPVLAGGAPGGA